MGKSKIGRYDVRRMRESGRDAKSLAEEYGVHEDHVRDILSGRSWKGAGGPVKRGRRPGRPRWVPSDDDLRAIRAALSVRGVWGDGAAAAGISEATLKNYVKRAADSDGLAEFANSVRAKAAVPPEGWLTPAGVRSVIGEIPTGFRSKVEHRWHEPIAGYIYSATAVSEWAREKEERAARTAERREERERAARERAARQVDGDAPIRRDGKLTSADAVAIRESGDSVRELSERHGVSLTTIRDVLTGRKWASAGGPIKLASGPGRVWSVPDDRVDELVDALSRRGCWLDAAAAFGVNAATIQGYASRERPDLFGIVSESAERVIAEERELFLRGIEARRRSKSWAGAAGAIGIPASKLSCLRDKFPDLRGVAEQAAMDGRNHHELDALSRAMDALDRHRTWLGVARELGITCSALSSYRNRHPKAAAQLEQKYRAGKDARGELSAFVYVFRDGYGMIKVGMSKNPQSRAKTLNQSGSSGVMDVLFAESAPDACAAESIAHAELADYRHHGEWFRVDADVAIAAVKEGIAWSKANHPT